MKSVLNLIIMAILILNVSCASMFSGTSQRIKVRSDIPGTKLYLDDEEIGTNETTVTVAKKRLKEVQLIAKKEGCETKRTDIETKFDSTSLLGLLIDFGLISILVVDWGINGAVREAERTNYVLNPVCPSTK
jgi:hypothetical protein